MYTNYVGINALDEILRITSNSIIEGQLPSGGHTGQVLTKLTDNDYDADWKDTQIIILEHVPDMIEVNEIQDKTLVIIDAKKKVGEIDRFPPAMTSNTAPYPFIVEVSSVYDNNPVWAGWHAFDRVLAPPIQGQRDSWGSGQGTFDSTGQNGNQWILLTLDTPRALSHYTIRSRGYDVSDSAWGTAPRTWIVEGSNDKNQWDLIDERINITPWPRGGNASMDFTVGSDITYLYYRFTITRIQNDAPSGQSRNVSIGQIEMHGNTITEVPPGYENVIIYLKNDGQLKLVSSGGDIGDITNLWSKTELQPFTPQQIQDIIAEIGASSGGSQYPVDINAPWTWPENEEIDLNNGGFCQRFTGTISVAANTESNITLLSQNVMISRISGGWAADFINQRLTLGTTNNAVFSASTRWSSIWPGSNSILLRTRTDNVRTNMPYDVQIIYTKL